MLARGRSNCIASKKGFFNGLKYNKQLKINDMEEKKDGTLIKPPVTLEEHESVRDSIINLMGNPYCDISMFLSLKGKFEAVDRKIEALKRCDNQIKQ